jgi:hypothetical protein
MSEPILFCWSGGKDSAMALHQLLRDNVRVVALLTTVTETYDRISMHGVFDGPIFRNPIPVRVGEIVERESFIYCDLLPAAVVGAQSSPRHHFFLDFYSEICILKHG